MLEYNLQPVVTSFISIALIMMMMFGMSRSLYWCTTPPICTKMAIISALTQWNTREVVIVFIIEFI